jgi:hypothetical protein
MPHFLPFWRRLVTFILEFNNQGCFTFWTGDDSQCLEHGHRAMAEFEYQFRFCGVVFQMVICRSRAWLHIPKTTRHIQLLRFQG